MDESALGRLTSWVWLVLAIGTEIGATLALRSSHGFTKPLPVVLLVCGYGVVFYALSRALSGIPLSTAYAIWSAAGTAVIATIGMIAFGESRSALKIVSLVLAVVAIAGLRLG